MNIRSHYKFTRYVFPWHTTVEVCAATLFFSVYTFAHRK